MKPVIFVLAYLEDGLINKIISWAREEDVGYLQRKYKNLEIEIAENEPEAIIDDDSITWFNKYGQKCAYQLIKAD